MGARKKWLGLARLFLRVALPLIIYFCLIATLSAWICSYRIYASVEVESVGRRAQGGNSPKARWRSEALLGPGCLTIEFDHQQAEGLFHMHVNSKLMRQPTKQMAFWESMARIKSLGHVGIAWWSIAFGYDVVDFGQGSWHAGIDIPFWSILATQTTAAWLLYFKRKRRARRGLCTQCGYDLRASKDRCPECGTPIRLDDARHWPVDKARGGPSQKSPDSGDSSMSAASGQ